MVLREDRLGGTARRRQAGDAPARRDGPITYTYISAADHMDLAWYPKDIIQSRVAKNYRAAAPKVVKTEPGTHCEW